MTGNEHIQQTETNVNQPERRVTKSMMKSNLSTNNDIRDNTRITRSMSRENETLAPNINNIVEFAMVGGMDKSYVNSRNFEEAWNHKDKHEKSM